MKIGISSSCFYPDLTEKAFRKVGELGAKTSEIFFNSESELHGKILNEIISIKEYYGIEVRTIHPFTSFAEPHTLFGTYSRRIDDMIEFYKKYCEAASALGAKGYVIHGGRKDKSVNEQLYFESYQKLIEASKPYGVLPAHENVSVCVGSDIAFLSRLRDFTGEDFRTVLDIKQCRRSGTDEFEFMDKFEGHIMQVHISDFNDEKDCLVPCRGKYDFAKLFKALKEHSYDESAIIELYEWGYDSDSQIAEAKLLLEKIEEDG